MLSLNMLLTRTVILMSLVVPISTANLAAAQTPGTDAFIFATIDAHRPIAEAILVDGLAGDWSGLPVYGDVDGDVGSAPLDIVGTAIAALDQEVLVRIETSATSSVTPYAFGILLDLGGDSPAPQIQLALDPVGGAHLLNTLDEETSAVLSTDPIPGLVVAQTGTTIEVSIPYSVLSPLLPTPLANEIQSASHRPWVRAFTLSTLSGAPYDRGPAAATYRLLPTPYPLDPDLPSGLPNAGDTPLALSLPLDGEWFLAQGADGTFSHNGCWCFDFIQVDSQFAPSDPPESSSNADYYAWGQVVRAPISGTVTTATDSHPDATPGTPAGTNNVVAISSSGFVISLFHFMQGGVSVSPSDVVSRQDPVGLVGNSGFSVQPHLHLQARSGGSSRPISLDVAVRLNAEPDLWERQISSWQPREGFLIERLDTATGPPTVPMLSPLAIGLLAGLVAAVGGRKVRGRGPITDAVRR